MFLLINSSEVVNEELLEHINQFLGSVFSTVVIQINTINNKEFSDMLKMYIDKMNSLFNNKDIANSKKANVCFILFYINLINYEFFKQNNINLLQNLIEFSFNELTKDDIIRNLNNF